MGDLTDSPNSNDSIENDFSDLKPDLILNTEALIAKWKNCFDEIPMDRNSTIYLEKQGVDEQSSERLLATRRNMPMDTIIPHGNLVTLESMEPDFNIWDLPQEMENFDRIRKGISEIKVHMNNADGELYKIVMLVGGKLIKVTYLPYDSKSTKKGDSIYPYLADKLDKKKE